MINPSWRQLGSLEVMRLTTEIKKGKAGLKLNFSNGNNDEIFCCFIRGIDGYFSPC